MTTTAEPPADPDRYEEAIRAFRRRVPMTDPEFRALVETERERAFWIAGVAHAGVVQQALDAIDRAITKGTTLEEFQAEIGEKLAASWGGENPARVETVFRTNVMTAYNAGRHEVITDPDVQKARPYVRFETAGDSRVSDICEAIEESLHGRVLRADDPFVRRHWPPLHPNCRSQWTAVSEDEARELGITRAAPDTKGMRPADGFGRAPTAKNLEPDISGFDPALQRLIRGPHE